MFDDLWRVWCDYFGYYVVENKDLRLILYHVFLGAVLTHKNYTYVESAELKSTRLHTFFIQESGTGKSQAFEALKNILEYLKIPARKTIQDNEASLTGTTYRDLDNKIVVKKGSLSTLYSLSWDEGSFLLKPSPYMHNITDVFQAVMDEPGKVSKAMKLAPIDYQTNVTVTAGSYMFNEFKYTLMTKGFLQRMFINYKVVNKQEKESIRIGVNWLKLNQNFEMVNKLKHAIKVIVDRIPEPPNKYICFNKKDVKMFGDNLATIYKAYFEYQYVGEKQSILETFNNRLHRLIDKIATQKAIVEGKKEVTYEDMLYAEQVVMLHIKSLLNIFDYFYGGRTISYKEERKQMIVDVVKQNNNINQQKLLSVLKQLKLKGKWDLGYNRTLYVINDLIDSGALKIKKDGNNKYIFV